MSINDITVKSESFKKHESWVNSKWRPMMAWLYMATCAFDFLVAPVGWAIITANAGQALQWAPITLQGSGLYHIAMGAIIGITAYSRGREKILFNDEFGTPITHTQYSHQAPHSHPGQPGAPYSHPQPGVPTPPGQRPIDDNTPLRPRRY